MRGEHAVVAERLAAADGVSVVLSLLLHTVLCWLLYWMVKWLLCTGCCDITFWMNTAMWSQWPGGGSVLAGCIP